MSIGSIGFTVSHLQYADDTIIFLHNDSASVKGIKRVLQSFFILTGLKVNFHTSHLYGFHEDICNLHNWASILGCQVGGDSINYLGADICASPKLVKFWDPLIQKLQGKLALWKGRLTNQAGKTVLLKAAFDSMPIYWYNLYLMPKKVETKIDILRKSFFWGEKRVGVVSKPRMHSLGWNKICRPKEAGGLGLVSLRERNLALLFKWWWRSCEERGSF